MPACSFLCCLLCYLPYITPLSAVYVFLAQSSGKSVHTLGTQPCSRPLRCIHSPLLFELTTNAVSPHLFFLRQSQVALPSLELNMKIEMTWNFFSCLYFLRARFHVCTTIPSLCAGELNQGLRSCCQLSIYQLSPLPPELHPQLLVTLLTLLCADIRRIYRFGAFLQLSPRASPRQEP